MNDEQSKLHPNPYRKEGEEAEEAEEAGEAEEAERTNAEATLELDVKGNKILHRPPTSPSWDIKRSISDNLHTGYI